MNAIRKNMVNEINKTDENKTTLTLVNNEKQEDKKEPEKMTKEYLTEQLYYFYTNGGPVMDI